MRAAFEVRYITEALRQNDRNVSAPPRARPLARDAAAQDEGLRLRTK